MSGVTSLQLSYQIAGIIDIKPGERQELLEINSVRERLEKEIAYLAHEIKILEIEKKIASKTQEKFDKNVREQVLRERMKTIEKELGEDDDNKETKEIAEKIKTSGMPEEVRKKAEKELSRLAQMSQYNPESSYVRTYLDWLVELPWTVSTKNDVVIKAAEAVLNEDHYGLDKIKERILEYLAVMKLRTQAQKLQDEENAAVSTEVGHESEKIIRKAKSAPTILCFVGPPGVGKTSIGKSIARSIGRKFVKMSLGGIRDEAEIRGHRRTYVGALPDASSRALSRRGPIIRCSCLMK